MIEALLFIVLPIASLLVFALPTRQKFRFMISISAFALVLEAVLVLRMSNGLYYNVFSLGFSNPNIYIDKLSLIFLCLLNIAFITGLLYTKSYLKHNNQGDSQISIHYTAYLWFYIAMTAVLMFRDSTTFIIAWEAMTGSSFILIMYNAADAKIRKTAISYLVQMHICLFLLIAAFGISQSTGLSGFNAVEKYFATTGRTIPVFLLFLAGFGYKAGFIPLHTWLPEVYPAAPGNVSGFMSAISSKLGIYGLIRVVLSIQNDLFTVGTILLVLSCSTAIFGIAMAAVQRDMKKLLSYSSVENIGIIGMGISLGVLGTAGGYPLLSAAGYIGAVIHSFNHGLFKSILFFSADSVYLSTRTNMIDKMGGIIKKMPNTSLMFFIGCASICSLPLFNGFVSKFIIYKALFNTYGQINPATNFAIAGVVFVLTLVSGMSILTFTKAFGLGFLGVSRSNIPYVNEDKGLWQPLIILAIVIVFIGVLPFVILDFASGAAGVETNFESMQSLRSISLLLFGLAGLISLMWYIRKKHLKKKIVEIRQTWGCGYSAATSKMEYTSSSFVSDFELLAGPVTHYRRKMQPIEEIDIFPNERTFKGEEYDVIKQRFIDNLVEKLRQRFLKLSIFQTGHIQHYILLAVIFMFAIFILTWLGMI